MSNNDPPVVFIENRRRSMSLSNNDRHRSKGSSEYKYKLSSSQEFDLDDSEYDSPLVYSNSESNSRCPLCSKQFTLFRPRHRCRACGQKVCEKCSRSKIRLQEGDRKCFRTCDSCAKTHQFRRHASWNEKTNQSADPNSLPVPEISRETQTSPKLVHPTTSQLPTSYLKFRHGLIALIFLISLIFRLFCVGSLSKSMLNELSFNLILSLVDTVVSIRGLITGCIILVILDEGYYRLKYYILCSKATPENIKVHPLIDNTQEQKESFQYSGAEEENLVVLPETSAVTAVSQSDKFSSDRLKKLLAEGDMKSNALPIDIFLGLCVEIARLIECFGTGTSLASNVVYGYVDSVKKKLNTSNRSTKELTVQEIITEEYDAGTASIGGKKNPSLSRCILRLLWYIDFIEAIIRNCFIDKVSENSSEGLVEAYNETIGSRHPWMLRRGIMLALSKAPPTTTFLKALKVQDESGVANADAALTEMKKSYEPFIRIQSSIHKYLEERDLLNIP